ncbi:MAG: hypothetical protein R3E95_18245 [Thiolinea sp.]
MIGNTVIPGGCFLEKSPCRTMRGGYWRAGSMFGRGSGMNDENLKHPHSKTSASQDDGPYPGLRPFREDERGKFFGRDTDTDILIDKILTNRLTLLFAASGVGKSPAAGCGYSAFAFQNR